MALALAETPSKQLSIRLERLEKDLQLLTGMQTLIMADGAPQTHKPNSVHDFPERDINPRFSDPASSSSSKNKRSIVQVHERAKEGRVPKGPETTSAKSTNGRINNPQIEYMVNKSTITDEIGDGNLELLEALKSERERRVDTEDSARIVAYQLQQTEDELKKERETKQMLLVGTLQLKNKISGQEIQVKEREDEVKQVKEELASLQSKLASMVTENAASFKKFRDLIYSLKSEKKLLLAENKNISAEKKIIESQLEESCKQSAMKEQSIQSQEQKLITKLNQMASKCAQVDKERENLSQELQTTLDKLETTDKELQEIQKKHQKLEADCDRDLILKDCILDKLKSDMLQQKERFELQIKTSQTVVSKTKSLILQIRQERDDLRKILSNYKHENESFQKKTTQTIQQYQEMVREHEQFKRKIKTTLQANHNNIEKLKKENANLKSHIKKIEDDKAIQAKLTISQENEFLKEKSSYHDKIKHFEAENDNLKAELTRYTDNFRVLQKISEDQAKTIQTLRNERDEQRKIKFSLESEIREKDSNESTLLRKLEQEQRKVYKLEETIEDYQRKVSAWEEELREHNCEDFVETTFKRKLSQIELEAKERYEQWEQSLKAAESDRDKALRDARYHEKIAGETKSQCETRLVEITSKAKQDFQKLKVDTKRSLTEKDTKIMELESNLEQQKLQAQQMQRNLYGKIQQLQCALNVYLTGPTAFGNPGVGPTAFTNFI